MRVLTLLFLLPLSLCSQPPASFQSLFDGTTLDGWIQPENNIWWSAADGIMSLRSDSSRTGNILWTVDRYRDFIVQLDFRFIDGVVDSGVFLRNEKDQIQIGISGSLKRDMTCSPYIPGKGYPVEAKGIADLLSPDDWNAMQIEAIGNHYRVWLNDVEVMTYVSDTAIDEGPLGLQLHNGNDMAIDFRDIRLARL